MAHAPKYVDKHELAAVLSVSPRTVEKWTAQRRIPFRRLSGRCVRYDLAEVVAFVEATSVPVGGVGMREAS